MTRASDTARLLGAGGTFSGDLTIPEKIIHSGDTDTHLKFAGANDLRIISGDVEHATFDGTIVFNQSGADMDFRVESDSNENMFFVDAGNNRIGMGSNAPTTLLHLQGSEPDIFLRRTDLTNKAWRFNVQSSTGDLNIKSRNDDGSASTTSMIIAHDGYVTMPLQPAFMATSSSQSNLAASDTLAFGNEVFDQNADYNNSNYTFTAPVTGRYQLNATIRTDNLDTAANYIRIFLKTSNRNYEAIYDLGGLSGDPSYWTFTITTLADMDASDTAFLEWSQSGGASQSGLGNVESSFSGYLVA